MGFDRGILLRMIDADGIAQTVGVFFQYVAQELVAIGKDLSGTVGGILIVQLVEEATEPFQYFAPVVEELQASVLSCSGVGLLRGRETCIAESTLGDGAIHLDGMGEV